MSGREQLKWFTYEIKKILHTLIVMETEKGSWIQERLGSKMDEISVTE